MRTFKRGKSTGQDGPPSEFYLIFWDILAPDLLAVFMGFLRLHKSKDKN